MLRPLPLVLALGLLAGAAHAQEREWTLDASEEDAYLIFGVPESDDVGVSLWCPIGKGVVSLFLPVPTEQAPKGKGKAMPVTVSAGAVTETLRGQVDHNPESAVSSLEAEIAAEHPLILAMRETDRFSVKAGEQDIIFPLFGSDLEGLLALCAKR
jgi:hypothetical protein